MEKPLEKVFPTIAVKGGEKLDTPVYNAKEIYICKIKLQSLQYLFLYSRALTVNTTAQRHLKEPVRM